MENRSSLTRYAWLSIAAAIITISLKAGAYFLTGSVGLLSDALESMVNLVAAVVALAALSYAAQPADEEHNFGHDKVEYFSSGVEGALILVAAVSIAYTSIDRLLHPQPLEQVGVGVVISVGASLVNLFVARILLRAGREHHSITLEADSHHLMTDVWTSVGVVAAVAVVGLTRLESLDAIIALAVAANIIRTGVGLLRRSFRGLVDSSIPAAELAAVQAILDRYQAEGVEWHALRTRESGARRFIAVHALVPGDWTVQRGHDLVERVELEILTALPNATVTTHLEPKGDKAAYADIQLDRKREG
jgi:cation diffusion facilitator family transporter